MTEARPAVVVLARPGLACDRLEDAVRDAGAHLLGTVDPLAADPPAVLDLAPQALLVALEPAVDEALDAFQALLWDPAVSVIYEEAELVVQRDGWEAARWRRHLAAKLHRHDDVLPPGGERDHEGHAAAASMPAPGVEPRPGPTAGGSPESGTGAQAHADASGATAVPDADTDGTTGPTAPASGAADTIDLAGAWPGDADPDDAGLSGGAAGDASGVLALDDEGASVSLDLDEIALGGSPLQGVTLDIDALASPEFDPDASMPGGDAADIPDSSDIADRLHAFDAFTAGAGQAPPHTRDAPHDEPAAGLDWDMPVGGAQDTAAASPRDADASAPPAAVPTGAGLSLAERDGTPLATSGAAPDPRLADLEQRIGGLSLADVESYGHGVLRGAVLVEGGLGGPDAVRQLLAAIPESFPRALLVRLRLDGGRYDRLVRQMARATALPVALAEPGGVVEQGTVYFLPPTLGLRVERGQLRFVEDAGAAGRWPDALPADDSAAVFLSGADAALVAHAMHPAWAGGLVVAQTLDGCYDPSASAAVAEHGGALADPGALAALLVQRWNPGGGASGIELETTDD